MCSLKTLSVFIWFSFLYRTLDCSEKQSASDAPIEGLTREQQRQLYDELTTLSPEQRQQLFQDLQRQGQEFVQSQNKWARLREALPDPSDLSPISQGEVNSIRKTIRSGAIPVVRNKRTLKFLVKSLAEILGLRWTLLKYSLIPGALDTFIGPLPPSSPPAPAAPKMPAAPPSRRLPPPSKPAAGPPSTPRRPPPPPPKPSAPAPRPAPLAPGKPASPASSPALPAPPPAASVRPPPPTIPNNQIDPNTIRYPFRPAPTIPFLTFAPLPPGVTVPYPPLFQWPTPAPPATAMPAQPPCAAPPPAAPKAPPPAAPKTPPVPPKTPSRLPLPKPRPPVPPPPKPARPVLPASPSKTPLKLEYDHPVRIEIFNNVKPFLPASGNVYSGDSTLADLEKLDETTYLSPTQAINAINEEYGTESAQEQYNKDYDYGYITRVPDYVEEDTTFRKISDYEEDKKNHYQNTHKNNDDYYDDRNQNYEETTPANGYNGFVSNIAFNDYPEQAEENRPSVNIKVNHFGGSPKTKKNPKRIRKLKKYSNKNKNIEGSESKRDWKSVVHLSATKVPWTTSHPPNSVSSSRGFRGRSKLANESRVPTPISPADDVRQLNQASPKPRARNQSLYQTNNIATQTPTSLNSWNVAQDSKKNSVASRHSNPFTDSKNKPFRIVVPSRKRRDIFFDDAFKNFNSSAFESFMRNEPIAKSEQPQFYEAGGKLIPALDYRKKLEIDVEKYVEKYVEQQISKGEIDVRKPKTTIIELKTNHGPPIKTVTTTLSKIVDGDKPLLESVLEFSKDINPVSNVGELTGDVPPEPTVESEVSKAFQNDPKTIDIPFSWSFSN